MKKLPSYCKRLDLHVARMTTLNVSPVSSCGHKNSVPKYYFRAIKIPWHSNKVYFFSLQFVIQTNTSQTLRNTLTQKMKETTEGITMCLKKAGEKNGKQQQHQSRKW